MRACFLGVALTAGLLLLVGPTAGGPLEARRLWEHAKEQKHLPWRTQVRAWRAVLDEAIPTDRLHRRALESCAKTLRSASLPHGAAALEARAARLGTSRNRGRLGSRIGQARGLRAEGDLDAAAPLLDEVADLARTIAPTMADRARAWQLDDVVDRADRSALERLRRALDEERAGLPLRLEATGALGLLRLRAGDERGARRALAQAERLYRTSQKGDADRATRCAKLWLDLELRRRLRD